MEVGGEEAVPELVPAVPFSSPPPPDRAAWPKVAVTILTGFLGAGKSTLLRRILSERHGWRVAVIMNELGPSSGVDKAMVWERARSVGEEWLEVENGCLCCTAKNETFLAIESLLAKRPDIEHIIIEASGAADPAALIQKLWVDEALESRVVLDAVVCVVDCSHALRLLSPESPVYSVEAARQVALCDRLLLNKTDLVPPETVAQVRHTVLEVNPTALTIPTRFSDAPLESVLLLGEYGRGGALSDPVQAIEALLERAVRIAPAPHSARTIRSFTVYLRRPLRLASFERWVFTLLWERRAGDFVLPAEDALLRVKGILQVATERGTCPYSLQVVQEKYEIEPLLGGGAAVAGHSETAIIFIGHMSTATEEHIKKTVADT